MTEGSVKPKSHRWVFHVLEDISEFCDMKALHELKLDIDAVIEKHDNRISQLPANSNPTDNLIQFKRPN